MKGNIRRLVSGLLTMIMIMSLSACKKNDEDADPRLEMSKEELIATIDSTTAEWTSALDQVAELQTALEMKDNTEERGAIREIEDGSKRRTFTTVDDMITLPVEFAYPGTEMTGENASINITSTVKISKPSPTWSAVFEGTTLRLYNTEEEVAGAITVGKLNNEGQEFKVAELQTYMEETLLVDVPYDKSSWTKLFIEDRQRGVDVTCNVLIDEEQSVMRCGIIGSGELSVQYMFVYKGDRDGIRDDLVRSLLRNISIRGNELRISAS